MPDDRIIPNVCGGLPKRIGIEDSHFRKSSLPNGSSACEFSPSPKCEATFNELYSPLDRRIARYGQQHVEVVGITTNSCSRNFRWDR
jgi:hypothetical protein